MDACHPRSEMPSFSRTLVELHCLRQNEKNQSVVFHRCLTCLRVSIIVKPQCSDIYTIVYGELETVEQYAASMEWMYS